VSLLPFSAYAGEHVCALVSGCRKERRARSRGREESLIPQSRRLSFRKRSRNV